VYEKIIDPFHRTTRRWQFVGWSLPAIIFHKLEILADDHDDMVHLLDYSYYATPLGYQSILLCYLPVDVERLRQVLPFGKITDVEVDECNLDDFWHNVTKPSEVVIGHDRWAR
jgi:hypothetical protein